MALGVGGKWEPLGTRISVPTPEVSPSFPSESRPKKRAVSVPTGVQRAKTWCLQAGDETLRREKSAKFNSQSLGQLDPGCWPGQSPEHQDPLH